MPMFGGIEVTDRHHARRCLENGLETQALRPSGSYGGVILVIWPFGATNPPIAAVAEECREGSPDSIRGVHHQSMRSCEVNECDRLRVPDDGEVLDP